MFTFLKADVITQAESAHRFMVEVASNELDQDGVSLDVRSIDLLVSAPTEEAIARVIADTAWLKGYSLVSYWLPEDGCPEF